MQFRIPTIIILFMVSIVHAGATDQYNIDKKHLALQGYDPVSYFKNAPARGKESITTILDGVSYRFVSDENKKTFEAEPGKYKPTYGGWCATAMARGEKVEIDPNNYKLTNGRLFLFYNGFWGNARNDWIKDEASLTTRADTEWEKLTGE